MTLDPELSELHSLLIQELEDFAVFLISVDARIITWNPGVERFFGYSKEHFIDRNFEDIFTPEDRASGAPAKEMGNAREKGRASDVRWHLCHDQSRVFVEGVLIAVKDGTGSVTAFAKIARAVRPTQAAG